MKYDNFVLVFAILGSSFWGSWHCAAMCGPVASIAARRNSLITYHLARGLSYTLLGALAGFLGSFFLASEFLLLRITAGVLFSSILVALGIQTFRGSKVSWPIPLGQWTLKFFCKERSGLVLGLLSIFLPCGWLYSYVLAAVATKSAATGAMIMMLFWLAGIPTLSALATFMKATIQAAPRKQQMSAGIVLVAAGLYSLISFYFITCH